MGAALTRIMNDLTGDSAEEVKEQLQMLQTLADEIIEAKSKDMKASAFEDKSLPVLAKVDTITGSSIVAESGVGEGLDNLVDNLCNGDWVAGLKSGIKTALNTFLGSASAGRNEKREFHVIYDHNALLRVEVYYYKYHFSSKGLKDHGQTMLCYVAQRCVLDSLRADPQVVLFEVSKSIGDNMEQALQNLKGDAKFVDEFMTELVKLRQAQQKALGGAAILLKTIIRHVQ